MFCFYRFLKCELNLLQMKLVMQINKNEGFDLGIKLSRLKFKVLTSVSVPHAGKMDIKMVSINLIQIPKKEV